MPGFFILIDESPDLACPRFQLLRYGKRANQVTDSPFLTIQRINLLNLLDDSLECLRVVHSQVSEDLAVNFNTSLVDGSHEL